MYKDVLVFKIKVNSIMYVDPNDLAYNLSTNWKILSQFDKLYIRYDETLRGKSYFLKVKEVKESSW